MPPETPFSIQDLIALLTRITPQPTQTGVSGATLPGAGLNYLLNSNPAFAYTSPSTISSAFNPEMLIASGLFDPARVSAMQQSILAAQQADWAKQLDPYMKELTADFTDANFSYNYNPILMANPDAMSALTNAVFPAIKAGTTSAETAKSNLIKEFAPGGTLSDISRDVQAAMIAEIDNYNTELPKYFQAQQKLATETAAQEAEAASVLERMGLSAPSIDTARMQFYKDLGVPQLALLPDVTEQYEFGPEAFIDPKVLERATGYEKAAQEKLDAALPKAEKDASRATMMSEYVSSRLTAADADKLKKDYIEKQKATIPEYNEWYKTSPKRGDYNAYVRWKKDKLESIDKVANNLYKSVKPRTSKVYTPEMINPQVGRARTALGGVEKMRALETERATSEGKKLTAALTAAGITPFQQAMLAFQLPPKKKK